VQYICVFYKNNFRDIEFIIKNFNSWYLITFLLKNKQKLLVSKFQKIDYFRKFEVFYKYLLNFPTLILDNCISDLIYHIKTIDVIQYLLNNHNI